MKNFLSILAVCLLLGCTSKDDDRGAWTLEGAWTLRQVTYPFDRADDTYSERDGTVLRIYDGDSVMYQCWLIRTETGLIVRPDMKCSVTLIDKGGAREWDSFIMSIGA